MEKTIKRGILGILGTAGFILLCCEGGDSLTTVCAKSVGILAWLGVLLLCRRWHGVIE